MKTFVKVVALVVALVLVAALVVPIAFKGKIVEIVKREANDMLRAQLDFEKLDISLLRHFPNASVELKGLTIVGQERFAGDTIVAAKRLSVVVNLMSLFGDGGYEVSKIVVATASVHAHKLADGAVNWDIVKSTSEQPDTLATKEPSAFKLSIRDLRISGTTIRYEDDSTGMRFAAKPLALRLRGDLTTDKTNLDLQLRAEGMRFVSGGIPLLSGAEAELDAVIAADLKDNRFTFSNNKLRLNAIQVSLDGWVALLDNGVEVDLKAGCDKVQFKDVLSLIPAFYTREFRNLAAGGELSMALWARGKAVGTDLPAFEVKTEVRNGSFQYSSLPKAVTDINIAARISNPGGVMDLTVFDVSTFALKMAGNSASATLYATNLVSDPLFRASASGRVDLGAIKQVYPLEEGVELGGVIAADVKVSGRMSDVSQKRYEQIGAQGTFVLEKIALHVDKLPAVFIRRAAATITPQSMTLGDFGVTIGSSDITANGQLTGYIGYLLRGDLLAGRLYVKSELLDLNEIISSMPAEAADTTASHSTQPAQVLVVPQNLNLSLATELRKVLFQKMVITDIAGQMRVADGAVSLDGLSLHVFGGRAGATGSYSTAADSAHPQLKLSADIAGASFARTFEELETVQKLVPLFAKTGGDYAMSLNLSTTLDAQMSPDLTTLNAAGEIRSSNIQIQNIAAFDALAKALKNDALRQIEAKDVSIRFTIRDGRISTQPFDLKLGGATINLSGSTGLDQTIDYTARVALPASVTGGILQAVNVGIGGTFSAPKITLDMKEAAEQAVKNALDQGIQKLTGSESLSEEVQKQTARLRDEARKAGEKLVAAAEQQRDKIVEAAAAKGALAKFAAEKAGDKLVSEAQRQAENLQAEAERQIEKFAAKQQ